MKQKAKLNRNYLALWIGFSAAVLVAEYLTGPYISFPILFVIPVAMAARYRGRNWGIVLAIVLSTIRFSFSLMWPTRLEIADAIINMLIRTTVLVSVAVLIDRMAKQASQIKVLRGLLSTCACCKRIRTEAKEWQQIEAYITRHSEARFSHTFCPECAQKYYGEYLDNGSSGQANAA